MHFQLLVAEPCRTLDSPVSYTSNATPQSMSTPSVGLHWHLPSFLCLQSHFPSLPLQKLLFPIPTLSDPVRHQKPRPPCPPLSRRQKLLKLQSHRPPPANLLRTARSPRHSCSAYKQQVPLVPLRPLCYLVREAALLFDPGTLRPNDARCGPLGIGYRRAAVSCRPAKIGHRPTDVSCSPKRHPLRHGHNKQGARNQDFGLGGGCHRDRLPAFQQLLGFGGLRLGLVVRDQ